MQLTSLSLAVTRSGGMRGVTEPAAPENTALPTISGSTVVGQTLQCSTGTWTGYPAPAFSYQWRRTGVEIGGAQSPGLLLVEADIGETLDCVVTATNTEGTASATATAVGPITGIAPVIAGAPTISGTAEVGSTLTASPASVTGTPTPVRTWQWLRDGIAISGATASTRLLATADGGTDISVVQIETNVAGFDEAESAAVAVPVPTSFALADLTDVSLTAPADGDELVFDATESKWTNQ